jgi:hypothetical protein
MVERLNNDILQWAARLAEDFPYVVQRKELESDAVDKKKAYEIAGEVIGVRMVQLLEAARNVNDPMMALQTAFQACLITSCESIVSMWHPGGGRTEFFLELYGVTKQAGAFR